MKKKIAALGLAIALTLSLTACGASVNDANVRVANIVLRAVDDYLDGYIDAKEAYQTIDGAYDELDKNDPNSTEELSLSIDMTSISIELSKMNYSGDGDLEKVKEKRNEIASLAGLKKRR